MKSFDQFVADWLNKTVDWDGVYRFQCVDLVMEYLKECFNVGQSISGHNAIDFWTNTPAPLIGWRVATNTPQKGDIVILNGLSGNSYGHITLATGLLSGNTYEAVEQNGQSGNGLGMNGDQIRKRWIDRNRIAGVLRPPASTPQYPFSIEHIARQPMRLKQTTHQWNIEYGDFDSMSAHPVATDPVGKTFTAVAIAHHHMLNGKYSYYLTDPNYHVGYNVLDCEPYTPPPPIPATTYEELAKPREKHVSRKGGAEKWQFGHITGWSSIRSSEHKDENYNTTIVAIAHAAVPTAAGYDMTAYEMEATDYDIANHRVVNTVGFSYVDVTEGLYTPPAPKVEPKPEPKPEPAPAAPSVPVEPATPDNTSTTVPPVGTQWKATQQRVRNPQTDKLEPVRYRAKVNHLIADGQGIKDYDGKRPDHDLKAGQEVSIYSKFLFNGKIYGRPYASMINGTWYGILWEELEYVGDDLVADELVDRLRKTTYKQTPNIAEFATVVFGILKAALDKLTPKTIKR